MNTRDYAKAIRAHDWSACMSDSLPVVRRAAKAKTELVRLSTTTPNHARLWALGSAYCGAFTWGPSERHTEAMRFEEGWRWVGAYCWARGLKLTEDEAKALVSPVGTVNKHNQNLSGFPDWKTVDARLKGVTP